MRSLLVLFALFVSTTIAAAEGPPTSDLVIRTTPDRVSKGRIVPEFIGPAATYPQRAQDERIGGTVALRVTTDEGGFVKLAKVTTETPVGYGFGEAAVKAVQRWKFQGQSRLNTSFDYTMNFKPK
jgi:TonB family protein